MEKVLAQNYLGVEVFGYQQELKRVLKFRDLVIYGMVFMSPVSAMTLFGIMFGLSNGHVVLSFLTAFVAMLFTAYSYGRMVQAFPIAGSTYSYTQRGIHPNLGFLSGWVMMLDYALIPMLLYLISASFANAFIPAVPIWVWVIFYALLVTAINLLGIETAAKANLVMTLFMLLAVIGFGISGVYYLVSGHSLSLINPNAIYHAGSFSSEALIRGAAIATVSFLGFDAITTLSEETDIKGNKIALAIIVATSLQTIIYLTVAYLGSAVAMELPAFDNPDTAFFIIAKEVGGNFLQVFITLVIVVSGVATALAGQSAASRLLYGMGRDRVIPRKFFAYLHPKHKTPWANIILMAVIGSIGAITLSLNTISDLVAFGALFGFTGVNLAVISYYFIKNKQRNVLKFLLLPLIGVLVSLYILFGLSTLAKIVGFTWLGLGLIYLVVRSLTSKEFTQNLANIKVKV